MMDLANKLNIAAWALAEDGMYQQALAHRMRRYPAV